MKKILASAVSLALIFNGVGVAFAGNSTIEGKVALYDKQGALVETVEGKVPAAEGALHECIEPCTFRSEGITLKGTENTKMAFKGNAETFNLCVGEGVVDFIFAEPVNNIGFYLPDNTFTRGVLSDGPGKAAGILSIGSDGVAEIQVNEGSMTFSTADGPKVVEAGQMMKIELGQAVDTAVCQAFAPVKTGASQAVAVQQEGATGFFKDVISGETALVAGAVVVAGLGAGAVILNDDDDTPPAPTPGATAPAAGTPPTTPPAVQSHGGSTNPPADASQST